MLSRGVLIPLLTLCCAFAETPAKPKCEARNRGELWPPVNLRDSCHALEMCTRDVWKYRWEPLTVSISQLAPGAKHKTTCEANHVDVVAPADRARPATP